MGFQLLKFQSLLSCDNTNSGIGLHLWTCHRIDKVLIINKGFGVESSSVRWKCATTGSLRDFALEVWPCGFLSPWFWRRYASEVPQMWPMDGAEAMPLQHPSSPPQSGPGWTWFHVWSTCLKLLTMTITTWIFFLKIRTVWLIDDIYIYTHTLDYLTNVWLTLSWSMPVVLLHIIDGWVAKKKQYPDGFWDK